VRNTCSGLNRVSRLPGAGNARWWIALLLAAGTPLACGDDPSGESPPSSGAQGGDLPMDSGGASDRAGGAAGGSTSGTGTSPIGGANGDGGGQPSGGPAVGGGSGVVGGDSGATGEDGANAGAGAALTIGGAGAGGEQAGGQAGSGGDGGSAPLQEWVGVVGAGQSLSVGVNGNPIVSTSPAYANLKLSLGARAGTWPIDPTDSELSLVPLVEPLRPITQKCCTQPYPTNIYGETYHTAMATQLSWLHQRDLVTDLVTVHTEVGQSATGIAGIKKNGTAVSYAASLFEVAAIKRLADAAGARYRVGAVVFTHGETDANLANYEDELVTLQANYEQDLRTITGQTEPIPMILSQQTVAARDGRPISTLAAWRAAKAHPEKFILSGPKYHYQHTQDQLHLSAVQYGRLGAKYAQVFHDTVIMGKPWRPLQPKAVSLEQGNLTVQFEVPKPPLAWDETLGLPHQTNHVAWAAGRGFEVEDAHGEVPITAVTIAGDSVQITLGREPSASANEPLSVRYAMTQDVFAWGGGVPTGRLGQLHDSDDFRGLDAAVETCLLTKGSTSVTRASGGPFMRRSPRDRVSAPSAPGAVGPDVVIRTVAPDGLSFTLSEPWQGETGSYELELHANHWNYSVAFELTIP
jgi:hypothetical protein